MKTALVLEGGAMRGIYTAGILDVLMENDIKVDAVIGVSAGALFGINYVSHQIGRVVRYNKKYAGDKRYFGMHSFLTTGNIMNKEFCFNDIIYKLDKFDFDTFSKSKVDFYSVVTNLETGKAEYIKTKDLEKDMEYFRASGSMPLVSKIVEVNGNKYLDGGIADSIPLQKAKELGYDRIIVVLTRPKEYRKKPLNMMIYKLVYRKYPNFIDALANRYKNYNNTVEQIIRSEKQKEIFVFRPKEELNINKVEKDVNKIQAVYDLGVEDANKLKDDLLKYLA